jgi:hypothetical protein
MATPISPTQILFPTNTTEITTYTNPASFYQQHSKWALLDSISATQNYDRTCSTLSATRTAPAQLYQQRTHEFYHWILFDSINALQAIFTIGFCSTLSAHSKQYSTTVSARLYQQSFGSSQTMQIFQWSSTPRPHKLDSISNVTRA